MNKYIIILILVFYGCTTKSFSVKPTIVLTGCENEFLKVMKDFKNNSNVENHITLPDNTNIIIGQLSGTRDNPESPRLLIYKSSPDGTIIWKKEINVYNGQKIHSGLDLVYNPLKKEIAILGGSRNIYGNFNLYYAIINSDGRILSQKIIEKKRHLTGINIEFLNNQYRIHARSHEYYKSYSNYEYFDINDHGILQQEKLLKIPNKLYPIKSITIKEYHYLLLKDDTKISLASIKNNTIESINLVTSGNAILIKKTHSDHFAIITEDHYHYTKKTSPSNHLFIYNKEGNPIIKNSFNTKELQSISNIIPYGQNYLIAGMHNNNIALGELNPLGKLIWLVDDGYDYKESGTSISINTCNQVLVMGNGEYYGNQKIYAMTKTLK